MACCVMWELVVGVETTQCKCDTLEFVVAPSPPLPCPLPFGSHPLSHVDWWLMCSHVSVTLGSNTINKWVYPKVQCKAELL